MPMYRETPRAGSPCHWCGWVNGEHASACGWARFIADPNGQLTFPDAPAPRVDPTEIVGHQESAAKLDCEE